MLAFLAENAAARSFILLQTPSIVAGAVNAEMPSGRQEPAPPIAHNLRQKSRSCCVNNFARIISIDALSIASEVAGKFARSRKTFPVSKKDIDNSAVFPICSRTWRVTYEV